MFKFKHTILKTICTIAILSSTNYCLCIRYYTTDDMNKAGAGRQRAYKKLNEIINEMKPENNVKANTNKICSLIESMSDYLIMGRYDLTGGIMAFALAQNLEQPAALIREIQEERETKELLSPLEEQIKTNERTYERNQEYNASTLLKKYHPQLYDKSVSTDGMIVAGIYLYAIKNTEDTLQIECYRDRISHLNNEPHTLLLLEKQYFPECENESPEKRDLIQDLFNEAKRRNKRVNEAYKKYVQSSLRKINPELTLTGNEEEDIKICLLESTQCDTRDRETLLHQMADAYDYHLILQLAKEYEQLEAESLLNSNIQLIKKIKNFRKQIGEKQLLEIEELIQAAPPTIEEEQRREEEAIKRSLGIRKGRLGKITEESIAALETNIRNEIEQRKKKEAIQLQEIDQKAQKEIDIYKKNQEDYTKQLLIAHYPESKLKTTEEELESYFNGFSHTRNRSYKECYAIQINRILNTKTVSHELVERLERQYFPEQKENQGEKDLIQESLNKAKNKMK